MSSKAREPRDQTAAGQTRRQSMDQWDHSTASPQQLSTSCNTRTESVALHTLLVQLSEAGATKAGGPGATQSIHCRTNANAANDITRQQMSASCRTKNESVADPPLLVQVSEAGTAEQSPSTTHASAVYVLHTQVSAADHAQQSARKPRARRRSVNPTRCTTPSMISRAGWPFGNGRVL